MGDPFMCENPLDPVNSLDFTDIWCGPWLLKSLDVYFSAGKVPKAPGLLSASGAWLATTGTEWRLCGFPPAPLKRFLNGRYLIICIFVMNDDEVSYTIKKLLSKEKHPPGTAVLSSSHLTLQLSQRTPRPRSLPEHHLPLLLRASYLPGELLYSS